LLLVLLRRLGENKGRIVEVSGEDDGEMIGDGFVDIMREDECDG